jgi:hypothetical protein
MNEPSVHFRNMTRVGMFTAMLGLLGSTKMATKTATKMATMMMATMMMTRGNVGTGWVGLNAQRFHIFSPITLQCKATNGKDHDEPIGMDCIFSAEHA